jgi:predicted DsbA family dithiol-disulfide isomerase
MTTPEPGATGPSGRTRLTIDIVSDVVCPFCLIGTRRLEEALRATPDVEATITFHPFLLDPDAPPAGEDLRERLRRKYGDPEPMFRRVEALARESGLELDFDNVRRSAPTAKAHTLLRHAIGKGTQPALADALFVAYFVEGRDIGDDDVLVGLAAKHGFSEDEARALVGDPRELEATRREAAHAAAEGIRGVPFFVFGGKLAVSGAQPVEVFRSAIARALDDA